MSRDGGSAPPSAPGLPRRRRRWSRFAVRLGRAARDPATYDVRRSAGLRLGFLLGLPVPILALCSSGPPWIDVVAIAAPFVLAAILAAAGRVAQLADLRGDRITREADTAERSHAVERGVLTVEAHDERSRREGAELLHHRAGLELALAQRVNQSLVPDDVRRLDVEVVVRHIPFAYVGGDYMHVALPRPDLLYLCIGDVAGHGVAAALVVSRIHGLVQRLVLEQAEPTRFLEDLNQATIRILEHTPFFMTFAVFRVDLAEHRIHYATAGHPAQCLLHADGSQDVLSSGNGLLGLGAIDILGALAPTSVSYAGGDTLVLFTDGLFEVAARGGGAMLGEAALLARLEPLATATPQALADEVLRQVEAFGPIGPFADDVSLMVARFAP